MCTSQQIISAPAGGAKKIELAINSVAASPAVTQPVSSPVSVPVAAAAVVTPQINPAVISEPVAKPIVAETKKAENPVSTPSRPSAPSYKKSISIKEDRVVEKKAVVNTEEVLPDLSAPFDQPMLEGLWRIYSEKLEKQGRMTLSAAMKKEIRLLEKTLN